jgi:hypothetical protein
MKKKNFAHIQCLPNMLYAYMRNPGGEVLGVFHYVQFFIPFTIIIKALFFSQRAQTRDYGKAVVCAIFFHSRSKSSKGLANENKGKFMAVNFTASYLSTLKGWMILQDEN